MVQNRICTHLFTKQEVDLLLVFWIQFEFAILFFFFFFFFNFFFSIFFFFFFFFSGMTHCPRYPTYSSSLTHPKCQCYSLCKLRLQIVPRRSDRPDGREKRYWNLSNFTWALLLKPKPITKAAIIYRALIWACDLINSSPGG